MESMRVKVDTYSPAYYGITLTKKQLIHLRRIACDRALPVGSIIWEAIQKSFKRFERYSFSEGG